MKLLVFLVLILAVMVAMIAFEPNLASAQSAQVPWWKFQAIDTMKYSRDPSRTFLNDPGQLQQVVDEQVTQIAETGATHIGIATPYDEEFLPVLETWVRSAREHGLQIWFRGNWSGWESWFGYERITRQEHLDKTIAFIQQNPDLFAKGDVFSACPECENGGPGDPRLNGDVVGHRKFLIDEYQAMSQAFRDIGKDVQVNYNSMNGDVAKLVMDKPTTQALGGIVVVDHYVRTPERLNQDITDLAQRSGGKVILGEFGAPIPDIHGTMTEEQQATWIDQSLALLAENEALIGLSYWTNMGGSTALWRDNGEPKLAVEVLKKYFSPKLIEGRVHDTARHPLDLVVFKVLGHSTVSMDGKYHLAYIDPQAQVQISASNYYPQTMTLSELVAEPNVTLVPINPSWWYNFRAWLLNFF